MRFSNKLLFDAICELDFHMQEIMEKVSSIDREVAKTKTKVKNIKQVEQPKRKPGRPRKES